MTPTVNSKHTNYVPVTFRDNASANSYKPQTINIPIGAVITGNEVQYTLNKKGQIVDQNGKVLSKNEILLTKAQLAAIETFANIDGDKSNITPEELCNGGGWGISSKVTKALQNVGSLFKLCHPIEGANAGEGPWASACFVNEKSDRPEYSQIDINLENCK